jgi:hypothetical protein
MKIFHYHPKTGEYLGEGLADESPLEPGVWLIPAQAVDVEPPQAGNGERVVWAGDGWQVEPIPAPEPEPEPEPAPQPIELTPMEKLSRLGLTVDDLKALLEVTP